MGCAVAAELAKTGCAVTLLERDDLAGQASGRNAGKLNPLYATPSNLLPLALEAFSAHAGLRTELATAGCGDFGLQPVIRIFLRGETDKDGLEALEALHARTPGFSSKWLDRSDLRQLEPRLTHAVTGGLLTEGALSVDGQAFTCCLAQAASKFGATVLREAAVGVSVAADRVTQVRTCQGPIECDDVVFATGPWIADLQSWLGVTVPVRASWGALLVLRPAKSGLGCDLTWGPTSLHRRSDGLVSIGAMEPNPGAPAARETWERLRSGGAALLPELAHWAIVDRIAADRPMTEGNTPIAARAPGWANAYVANGGGSKGLLLSALVAQRIRGLVAGDPVEALGGDLMA